MGSTADINFATINYLINKIERKISSNVYKNTEIISVNTNLIFKNRILIIN